MSRAALGCAAGVLAAALCLAGCSETIDGHPYSASADLGRTLEHAMSTVRTAHVQLRIGAGGITVTGRGDEKLSAGRTTAFDLTEHVAGLGTIRLILIGKVLYAKLPAAVTPGDKPWVRVSPNSTDPTLAPLARALQQIRDSASLRQYALFAQAATHVRDLGPSHAHGAAAELYSFTVLVDRLPANTPGASLLRASGLRSIPVRLWTDGTGRVVRMVETVSVLGQHTSTRVDLSRYDAPVTITAPPPDQVAN